LVRANVGDRYVLEKMRNQAANLGGEQSGHIILLDYGTTGDGIQTSLKLVEVLRDSKSKLGEIVSKIPEWPQKLININVGDNIKKNNWNKNEEILKQIKIKEKELENEGRVLVRTSGTEPIIRVMVEGKNLNQVYEIADFLSKTIRDQLI
ncbi:MAG: phosphoglucosamine mutase, partial [Fusobacterium sp.]